jgi:hypothetical protein
MVLERRCPKCGEPMYVLPYSDMTKGEIKTMDAICENCLHVEQVTVIAAKREK